MKVFVWHQIDKCSDNYHEDGGVVVFAESEAREICGDGALTADDATEVKSLEQLTRLDREWDGMNLPYNGDGKTRLKDLLPETEPFKDTKTADVFA